ncbi:hypothetical protein [Streptomyces sp. NPDC051109]|uniref:hypothetical protein n=1 Tax=Streptomyces sp. NPDC051109 TaxID=3365642 RepID=UPI0037B7D600
MARHHEFHADRAGHSITLAVHGDHPHVIELLVDGKELGRRTARTGSWILDAELAIDPPTPIRVRVHLPHTASTPRCTLEMDGIEEAMAQRADV